MEQNELVVFENFSILNQKAMSLPIGKVSIRQVLLITAGFFFGTILYLATTDLIYAGVAFAPFVVISMINTKIVSLDQIIRNNISFLIRGTSLSKRYLNSIKSNANSTKKTESKIIQIDEKKKQLLSFDGIIKSIESIILKKPKDPKENKSSKQKNNKAENHSVVLSVNHDENILVLSNLKNKSKKIFSKKENILKFLESSLDGIKLVESDYNTTKGTVIIPLHKSKKYSIKINDEKLEIH